MAAMVVALVAVIGLGTTVALAATHRPTSLRPVAGSPTTAPRETVFLGPDPADARPEGVEAGPLTVAGLVTVVGVSTRRVAIARHSARAAPVGGHQDRGRAPAVACLAVAPYVAHCDAQQRRTAAGEHAEPQHPG